MTKRPTVFNTESNYKATKLLVSVAFAERIERIRYLILNEVRF